MEPHRVIRSIDPIDLVWCVVWPAGGPELRAQADRSLVRGLGDGHRARRHHGARHMVRALLCAIQQAIEWNSNAVGCAYSGFRDRFK